MNNKELIERLRANAEHHRQVAHDCDCRPEDTANWQHMQDDLAAATALEQADAENAELAAQVSECTRAHPHEEMNPMCELRTEIARLKNEVARLNNVGLKPEFYITPDGRKTHSTSRDNEPAYTGAQLSKVMAERDALRQKWADTCERTDWEIAEISAKADIAMDALEEIRDAAEDGETKSIMASNAISTLTLTTGNAVKQIEARVLRRVVELCEDEEARPVHDVMFLLRRLADKAEQSCQ